jgi:hypothetical protein
VTPSGVVRFGGVAALALWVAGVSGAFGATVNWTALAIGVGLVALSRLMEARGSG